MGLGLITCGEAEDVAGVLTPVVGGVVCRFSMNFLLSSGCCSSLRWKKGKKDRRNAGEVESGDQGEEVAHMDGMEMDVKRCKTQTCANVSVMKCARNNTTCARSVELFVDVHVVKRHAIVDVLCGPVVNVVIGDHVFVLSVPLVEN